MRRAFRLGFSTLVVALAGRVFFLFASLSLGSATVRRYHVEAAATLFVILGLTTRLVFSERAQTIERARLE
jgi:hypothetical protein